MKKLLFTIFILSISSFIFISCSDPSSSSVGSSGSITHTYIKTTPPVNINTGITNDFVNVPDTGNVNSLIYSLDSIMGVDVTKIDIILMHNNIYDTLIHNLTNTGNNFIGTKFSDQATDSIKNGSLNYTGTFKPYRPLSVFNGQSIIGQWFLYINYWGTMKSGVIKSWGITITYDKVTPPPSNSGIVPLATGNKWVFRSYINTTGTDSLTNSYDSVNVGASYTVNGKTVYVYGTDVINYGGCLVRNETYGLWHYGDYHSSYIDTSIIGYTYKYPINQGETFLRWGYDSITCVNTNLSYTTLIGTYSGCIDYQYYYYPYEYHEILKPGLGHIGYYTKDLTTGIINGKKLLRYSLN
jgi:hypothetical protein